MLFFGHVGPGAFFGQRLKLSVIATAFFAILPDLVDKPLFVLGIAPYGRFIAHTVWFLLFCFGALWLAGRRRLAFAAAVGIASHFVLDGRNLVPLFWPLVQYAWPPAGGPYFPALDAITLAFEAFGLILLAACREGVRREFGSLAGRFN